MKGFAAPVALYVLFEHFNLCLAYTWQKVGRTLILLVRLSWWLHPPADNVRASL